MLDVTGSIPPLRVASRRPTLGHPRCRRCDLRRRGWEFVTYTVTLIPGDGIGPELARATITVLEATGLSFEWIPVEAGESQIAIHGTPLPENVLESIRETKVALKGPITTPVGEGFRSVNVTLRQALDLYANLRPARSMKGVETRYENVDLIIVRENTEDLYAGIEHRVGPDAAESIKIITRGGVGADRAIRLRLRGGQRPAQGHCRAQGKHHEAVRRPVSRVVPARR